MRYFARLAYDGNAYHGWQAQPGTMTVQGVIEDRISKLLGRRTAVVGCGRTDTGVHASDYVLHFDTDQPLDENFLFRLNRFLPEDITFYSFEAVSKDMHARFSAVSRTYQYHICNAKPLFDRDYIFYHPHEMNLDILNGVSSVILPCTEFAPFCKSNSGVDHYRCDISHMSWRQVHGGQFIFEVRANRFLRGMIRLLVGVHLNIMREQLSLAELQEALELQRPLHQSWSVPGHALFLTRIDYAL